MRLILSLAACAALLTAQKIPDLASLSVPEKVGQLLIPAIHPARTTAGSAAWENLARDLTQHHVGCIHVFRSTSAEMSSLINRAQAAAKIPLLVTADFEGGTAWIVRDGVRFPRGMGLAAAGDVGLVRRVSEVVAREARHIGVHVNFFPVMDVNNNPSNPIINLRAFGDRPADVSRLGAAYVRGLQEHGMLATAKHFPGHGDTETDSHHALPVVTADRARLDEMELPPFRAAIEAGVACVMSAHIAWPKVTGDAGLPATLSSAILTDLLRKELKFEGVCFTDALDMKGITRRHGHAEASIRAVLAGADALLFTQDVPKIAGAMIKAVEEGRLPMARLDEACGRILAAKRRVGPTIDAVGHPVDQGSAARFRMLTVQAEAIMRSMTLLRKKDGAFPVAGDAGARILHVAVTDPQQSWAWDDPVPGLRTRLLRHDGTIVDSHLADDRCVAMSGAIVLEEAQRADAIIVTAVSGLAAVRGKTGLTAAQTGIIRALASDKATLLLLGNPYGFPLPDGYGSVVLGYDYDRAHGEFAMGAVLGDYAPSGRLPIDVPGIGKRGDGVVKPR